VDHLIGKYSADLDHGKSRTSGTNMNKTTINVKPSWNQPIEMVDTALEYTNTWEGKPISEPKKPLDELTVVKAKVAEIQEKIK